ncbi:hypothetical protein K2X14_10160 [Acetobacter sp. TBRC 12305]|uniref:Uncharacterized protein n=1 Tax=Acetobacter garciniae TaxID=2817435 RepID=A0A939HKE8_9PROT|nr:hypothetical protein [Acetobacter garciniae]MBO1326060.1 hypothetical protein [Acetobacter garciniae]MBX0345196.1 hypothetical protein [Acetobacter garciniae]
MVEKTDGPDGKHAVVSAEQWRRVLSLTEEGLSLRDIAHHPGMPAWPVLRQHVRRSGGAATAYARARMLAAEAFEDRLLKELETVRGDDTAALRLRIDTLKWLMSKRAPARYGERTGADTQAPATRAAPPGVIRRIIVDPEQDIS